MKPGAVQKLYDAQEFRRDGDNTVYRLGYPVNFRQLDGTPSIQFSIMLTGKRADIDVDYRKSSGPKALFNGHLTAANSDVRAGGNFLHHLSRWQGLQNWWLSLFQSHESQTIDPQALASLEEEPEAKESPALIQEAVHDFYYTWLIDKQPRKAMQYYSVNSYSCLAEFQDGSSIDMPLARSQILVAMAVASRKIPDGSKIEDVLQPVSFYAPEAKPVAHPYQKEFALEHLREDVAYELYCRQKFHVALVERVKKPDPQYAESYGAISRLKAPGGSEYLLVQLWRKEEGRWKIVSWHLENPFQPQATYTTASPEKAPDDPAPASADDAGMVSAATDFLTLWLVKRDYAAAQRFVSEDTGPCVDLMGSPDPQLRGWRSWQRKPARAPVSRN